MSNGLRMIGIVALVVTWSGRTAAQTPSSTPGIVRQATQPAPEPAPRPADPGVMFVVLMDTPEVRILRVVLEPGAVRRVHTHEDVTFHLLMPLNGVVQVTMDKERVEAKPGQAFYMKKGTPHSFTNTGTTPVTIMETFVKPPPSPLR